MLLRAIYEANLVVIRNGRFLGYGLAILLALYSLIKVVPKFSVDGLMMGFVITVILGVIALLAADDLLKVSLTYVGIVVSLISFYYLTTVVGDIVARAIDFYGIMPCIGFIVGAAFFCWGIIVSHKYIEVIVLAPPKTNTTAP